MDAREFAASAQEQISESKAGDDCRASISQILSDEANDTARPAPKPLFPMPEPRPRPRPILPEDFGPDPFFDKKSGAKTLEELLKDLLKEEPESKKTKPPQKIQK